MRKQASVAAVQKAIQRDAVAKVQSFIDQGLPVDKEFKFQPMGLSRTMLDFACERGACQMVKSLIAAGADLNKGKYYKPLVTAALFCQKQSVKLLLDAGANPNVVVEDAGDRDYGYTALMAAAGVPKGVDIARQLLSRGADPKLATKKGKTALGEAVLHKNSAVIPLLLRAGGRIDGAELRAPIYEGDVDAVRLMIRAGADVNAEKRGRFGLAEPMPLEIAIQQRGANFVSDRELGTARKWRGLKRKSEAENVRYLQIIKLLIAAGAQLDRITVGEAPLYQAAKVGDSAVVKLLLSAGADPNRAESRLPWTTKYEETALHAAARNGFEDIVHALIRAGADLNRKDKAGKTAKEIELSKSL